MASTRRGLGTFAFFLAGLFLLALAPIDGEPLWVPLGLACSTFGAAVEIDARGPLPTPELLARAVVVLAGFALFCLGWFVLVIRPLRRVLNPRGRSPIVRAD